MIVTSTAFRFTRGVQALALASVRIPRTTAQQLHPNVIRTQLRTLAGQLRHANREAANGVSATVLRYGADLSAAAQSLHTHAAHDAADVREATRRSTFQEAGEVRKTVRSVDREATHRGRQRAEHAQGVAAQAARRARTEQRRQHDQDETASRGLYEDHNKADLSALLAKRGLPKTGTRRELVDRLVEDDMNATTT